MHGKRGALAVAQRLLTGAVVVVLVGIGLALFAHARTIVLPSRASGTPEYGTGAPGSFARWPWTPVWYWMPWVTSIAITRAS